jgi:hypothetical protein
VPGGRVQGLVVVANPGDGSGGSFHYLEQTAFAWVEQHITLELESPTSGQRDDVSEKACFAPVAGCTAKVL